MILDILLIMPSIALGQISITSNDIMALIGNSQVRETDTTGSMTINVGSSGANQTWDLTGVSVDGFTLPFNFITPQGTPFEMDFPSANFVYSYIDTSGNEGYNEINVYNYVEVTASHFSSLGSGVEVPGDTSFVISESNDVVPLPLTYNASWVSTESDTFGDPAIFATISLDTTLNTIDGWGTVQLPIGNFNCLRIRGDNKNTELIVVGGVSQSETVTNTISYLWLSKNNFAIAEAESQDNDTNPNFTNAASFQWLVSPITTGIKDRWETGINPKSYGLFQNYPNPFNPTTKIKYQLPKSSNVVVSVYDIDGRLVKTLVDKYQSAGEYSINWNGQNASSGIYFFRLDAGDFSAVKKGTLLK
jgi:hypothetical protein